MRYVQVHRFRDLVAGYMGKDETTYMTPKEARAYARALTKAARSVETETFANSTCGTFSLEIDGTSFQDSK